MRRLLSILLLLAALPCGATTYYLANASTSPVGNDSNSGTDSAHPWLTPNHAVNCGDVILAAASSSYVYTNFHQGSWGTVTCAAGNDVAWLKCATFDTCKIITSGTVADMAVDKSYWGIQGWEVQAPSTSDYAPCFNFGPNATALLPVHNVVFANNVVNGCGPSGIAVSASSGTATADYAVIVGNIVYNATQSNTSCYNGINIFEPANTDTLPGTHIYIAGNFSYGNFDPNPCAGGVVSDGEGVILDTLNHFSYTGQIAVENNIFVANGGRGWQVNLSTAPVYFVNNTSWGNSTDTAMNSAPCEDSAIQSASNADAHLNLTVTNAATSCASTLALYAYGVVTGNATDHVYQNWAYSASGHNFTTSGSGFTNGPNNTTADPVLASPSAPGAPSCGSASSVPNCMATVISNFTPTVAAAKAYGYQIPSSTAVYDPLFPQWLCTVTNLPAGLIENGCLQASATTGSLSGGTLK